MPEILMSCYIVLFAVFFSETSSFYSTSHFNCYEDKTCHNFAIVSNSAFHRGLSSFNPGLSSFLPRLSSTTSHRTLRSKILLHSQKDPNKNDKDDRAKLWVDRLFDPLVEKYSELPESEQSMIASIYQSAYFMVCLYVGIVLVRAYKAFADHASSSF